MSVLIKGMEMPKHVSVNGEKDTAYKCVILAHTDNSVELVIDTKFASAYDNGHNIQRYPITETPTPHGRLIDVDAFVKKLKRLESSEEPYQRGMVKAFLDVISCEPTIIEAEVSE